MLLDSAVRMFLWGESCIPHQHWKPLILPEVTLFLWLQGASDDAVSCAVMLEVLRVMSLSSEPLQHAVVFLFNGAEENVLQVRFIVLNIWFE